MEATEAQQEKIVRNIALGLDNDLVGIENTLKKIAERTEFRNMIISDQQETMTQIAELSPDIRSLFVMDAEGWFVSGTTSNLSVFRTKSYKDEAEYLNVKPVTLRRRANNGDIPREVHMRDSTNTPKDYRTESVGNRAQPERLQGVCCGD